MNNPIEPGLRGVPVGKTAIATAGKDGAGLTYRGYDIADLARQASFEEVAYLLLVGRLPTSAQSLDQGMGRKTCRGSRSTQAVADLRSNRVTHA